jgi:hypothetical protein
MGSIWFSGPFDVGTLFSDVSWFPTFLESIFLELSDSRALEVKTKCNPSFPNTTGPHHVTRPPAPNSVEGHPYPHTRPQPLDRDVFSPVARRCALATQVCAGCSNSKPMQRNA